MKTSTTNRVKLLSIMISISLCMSMVPAKAFGADASDDNNVTTELAAASIVVPFGGNAVSKTLEPDSLVTMCSQDFYFTVPSSQRVKLEVSIYFYGVKSGLWSLDKVDGSNISFGTIATEPNGVNETKYLEAGTYKFNYFISFNNKYGFMDVNFKVYSAPDYEITSPKPGTTTPTPNKPYYNFKANKKKITVAWNDSYTINYYYSTAGKLSFSSSNKKVATVNSKGITTFKGIGETKITTTQTETADFAKSSFSYILKIIPNTPYVVFTDAMKKGFNLTWISEDKKLSSGYEIRYSLKKNMKNSSKKRINKASKYQANIKCLKSKKTYYVQIRTFKKVSGKTYYSSWSKKRKVKTL